MVEQYEVEVRKKGSPIARFASIVIILVALIAIPVYLMASDPLGLPYGDEPKAVKKYEAVSENQSLIESQKKLEQDTEILAQPVYGLDDTILGMLDDVYVDTNTGEIAWASVAVDNDPEKGLRLISATDLMAIDENQPVRSNISREVFLNIPIQRIEENELSGFLSLRGLPNSQIFDPDGQVIGTVNRVTYDDENNVIENVYFNASGQEFYVPFTEFIYRAYGELYRDNYRVVLTERQAGGVEMYLKNSSQF